MIFIVKEQKYLNKPNLYETFFLGVLHQAKLSEQKEIIDYLKFKEKGYLKNVNQVYWRPSNDFRNQNSKIHKEFYSKIDHTKIIELYIIYPQLLFRNLSSGINFLQNNLSQPDHLGNFRKSDSTNNRVTIFQTPWGKYLNNLILPIYLLGFISLFLPERGRNRITTIKKNITILLIIIPVIFTANIVAGGINDFVKHNLSVYFLISVLFFLSIIQIGTVFYNYPILNLNFIRKQINKKD